MGLHECETIPPDQNCVHVPRLSWDSTSATKSRRHKYRTLSIHHMSRADQNCAGLKRAENIMRHVAMWSAVKQKGTTLASWKLCTGLTKSATKSCKFISGVKHHEQRIMLASPFGCGRSKQNRLTFSLSDCDSSCLLAKLEGWCCTHDHETRRL